MVYTIKVIYSIVGQNVLKKNQTKNELNGSILNHKDLLWIKVTHRANNSSG